MAAAEGTVGNVGSTMARCGRAAVVTAGSGELSMRSDGGRREGKPAARNFRLAVGLCSTLHVFCLGGGW